MTEAAKPKTERAAVNSSVPEHGPDPIAAAAAPCECSDRLSTLEGRWAAQDTLNKAMSWCMLAAACAVLYLLWTGAGSGGKDAAAK